MKWRFNACLGLLAAWSAVSCTADRGHAKIIGAQEESFFVPMAYVPDAFVNLRMRAASGLPPEVRMDYYTFCCRAHYPCIPDAWINPVALCAAGPCEVYINLTCQRGLCMVDGRLAMDFPVCTGSTQCPTPTGLYHVLEKDADHRSNLYDNAPMFCFMRLTWDGVGMHIGALEGVPSSHGCIRLPREACRKLFARIPVGSPVTIAP